MGELLAGLLPDDWDLEDELLICPYGNVIELDGKTAPTAAYRYAARACSERNTPVEPRIRIPSHPWRPATRIGMPYPARRPGEPRTSSHPSLRRHPPNRR